MQKQSDVIRRAPLATGQLRGPKPVSETVKEETSEEYLARIEDEFNKKIDAEVETLVTGMSALVEIASIEGKDKYQASQDAFQAECRAESMVLAATSLLSITHSLKLMLLLSDEETATRRAEELIAVGAQTSEAKEWAIKGWEALMNQGAPGVDDADGAQ